MKLVTICTVWFIACTFGQASASGDYSSPKNGTDLPSSVKIVSQSGGFTKYLIKGLFGTSVDWAGLNRNSGREVGPFAGTDTLRIDLQKGIGFLTTDRDPASFPDFFNSVAKYSGVFPTWEELVVRDQRARNGYGSSSFQLLCHYKTRGPKSGYIQVGFKEEQPNKLDLIYLQNPGRPQSPTYVLTISWSQDIGPVIGFVKGDPPVDRGYGGVRLPKGNKLVFRNGEEGEARLNSTTAHCMSEMNHCLRVFNSSENYVWEASEEFPGQSGVWALDLNGNGDEELVVASQEHGNLNVFVYGKSVLGN